VRLWRNARGEVRAAWVIVVFGVVALAGAALGDWLVNTVGGATLVTLSDPAVLGLSLPMALGAVPATLLTSRLFGERVGLRDTRWRAHGLLGLALGLGALTLATVVPALGGATTLRWSGSLGAVAALRGGVAFTLISLGEELALRGVVLQALKRGAGPVVAVLVTGSLFGVLHLGNPNASPVAAAIIMLVGWWFGAVTVRTGSLWCALGLHLSWNFCEGFVFGQPVSGLPPGGSLLGATWTDAGFFSGGAFGPEAAGWTAVLLAVATGVTALVGRGRRAAAWGTGAPREVG
jgi:membrane protease YdiL (CAAX protease family)